MSSKDVEGSEHVEQDGTESKGFEMEPSDVEQDTERYIDVFHTHAQTAIRYHILGQLRYLDRTAEEIMECTGLSKEVFDSICAGTAELTYAEIADIYDKDIKARLRVTIDWTAVKDTVPGKMQPEVCDMLWEQVQAKRRGQ